MDNATRIERLNATLYLASNAPPRRFDQALWAQEGDCGTTHCIAGWCMVSPWHRERGMMVRGLSSAPRYRAPNGEHYTGTRAFAEFHGIEYDEAEDIVINNADLSGNAAKRNVCRQLKQLIQRYGGRVMYDY